MFGQEHVDVEQAEAVPDPAGGPDRLRLVVAPFVNWPGPGERVALRAPDRSVRPAEVVEAIPEERVLVLVVGAT